MNPKPAVADLDKVRYRFEQAGHASVGVPKDKAVALNGRSAPVDGFDWSHKVKYFISDGSKADANTMFTLECVDVAPKYQTPTQLASKDAFVRKIASVMKDDVMPRCVAHKKVRFVCDCVLCVCTRTIGAKTHCSSAQGTKTIGTLNLRLFQMRFGVNQSLNKKKRKFQWRGLYQCVALLELLLTLFEPCCGRRHSYLEVLASFLATQFLLQCSCLHSCDSIPGVPVPSNRSYCESRGAVDIAAVRNEAQ